MAFGTYTTIINNIFSNNYSSTYAGGVALDNCRQFYNNIIVDNTTDGYGGGVLVGNNSGIYNCTIADNTSTTLAGATFTANSLSSIPEMINCIIYGNSPSGVEIYNYQEEITYKLTDSVVQNIPANLDDTTGTVIADPLLNVDYSLQSGSPAIDNGAYYAWQDTYTVDVYGNSRTQGGQIDIGAIESTPEAVATYYPVPDTNGVPEDIEWDGFAAYSPDVSNITVHASAPIIAEWTKSNEPGDTMALTGENIDIIYPIPTTNGIPTGVNWTGFSAYDPPVGDVEVSLSSPAIAEWTKSNDPGDTMAFTGENIDD